MSNFLVVAAMVKSFQNTAISNPDHRPTLPELRICGHSYLQYDNDIFSVCFIYYSSFLWGLFCISQFYLPYSHRCTTWFTPPSSTVQYPCKMEWDVRRWNFSAVKLRYSFICSGLRLYVLNSYTFASFCLKTELLLKHFAWKTYDKQFLKIFTQWRCWKLYNQWGIATSKINSNLLDLSTIHWDKRHASPKIVHISGDLMMQLRF